MTRTSRSPAAALLVLVAALACSDASAPVTIPVASVVVSPPTRTVTVGETFTVAAVARDAENKVIPGRRFEWRSNNSNAATVTAAGLVTAVGEGIAIITAETAGKEGQTTITVEPPAVPVSRVELDALTIALAEDATRQLLATPRDAAGRPLQDRIVSWSSSNESVALVSDAGVITAVREGSAIITAAIEGKRAQATVTVYFETAFDLMFSVWTGEALTQAELHTVDVRSPAAEPVRWMSAHYVLPYVSPSPDGTRIVFAAIEGGTSDLFVANRDGSAVARITSGASNDDQPVWSPDGTRIAFRRWDYQTKADVWVVNVDGSNAINITGGENDGSEQQAPAWSPNSNRIAFAHVTRGEDGYLRAQIRSVRADGSDLQSVTPASPNFDDQPAWSPDGQTILFVRQGPEHHGDLHLANASGGNVRALMTADPEGPQRSPAWSPDGKMIAFTSSHEILGNRSGDFQLYTVRADGSGLVRRTSNPIDKQRPAWVLR